MPIADAATRLGVSADTVRRRIKSGTLQARQEATSSGFRWLVRLEGQDPAANTHPGPNNAPSSYDANQIGELQTQLRAREREIAELHAILAHQALALQQLTAGSRPQAIGGGDADVVAAEEGADAVTVGWWQRWWQRVRRRADA